MASFNKVILMGNVTRNPDVRTIPGSNLTVASTGLAVNSKYKDKEEVMFIDITVFGKQAEVMGLYVTKGSPLMIEGRLTFRTWEKDGAKFSKHEIILDSFQMLGSKRDRDEFDENAIDKDDLEMGSDDDMIKEDDVPF